MPFPRDGHLDGKRPLGVVRAGVLGKGRALERRNQVRLAQPDETEPALRDGGLLSPVPCALVTLHAATPVGRRDPMRQHAMNISPNAEMFNLPSVANRRPVGLFAA
jgi:hypothetical protein